MSAVADEAPPPETAPAVTASTVEGAVDAPAAEEPAADAPPADDPAAIPEAPAADALPAEEAPPSEPVEGDPPADAPPANEAPTAIEAPAAPPVANLQTPAAASAPIDCATIVGSNDDSGALDACLAAQNASQRGISTMTTPVPADNPALAQSCGVDLVLVLDVSGSISDAGAEGAVTDAANGFLSALANTGSQATVVRFASSADTLIPPQEITDSTQVSQGTLFGAGVGTWTNWQGGLEQAADTFTGDFDPQLIVMVTDGNANSVNGDENVGETAAMNAAIPAANTLKNGGSHMFAVGVGEGIDAGNLDAITGGGVYPGTDFSTAGYTLSNNFSDLGATLSAIVQELCGGTVRIHKSIGGADAANWVFTSEDDSVAPASGTTAADGWTDSYDVSDFGDADSRTITFTEETQAFHSFGTVQCQVGDDPVTTDPDAATNSWSVVVPKLEFVECYVTNVYTPPPPTWELTKTSSPGSGHTVQPGDQISYRLYAENTSAVDESVVGATAVDDVSGVLDFATINESASELASVGLVLVGTQLTWTIPTIENPGDTVFTEFTVTVNEPPSGPNAGEPYWGEWINNSVEPSSSGGECPGTQQPAPALQMVPVGSCETTHRIIDIDLVMLKTASKTPVDSDRGDLIDYTLKVTNTGQDPTRDPLVTDTLPEGVTLDGGVTVITEVSLIPPHSEGVWIIDVSVPGVISLQYDGLFYPGDVATISFQGLVGELAQPDSAVAVPDLVNEACVAGFRYADDMAPDLVAESTVNTEKTMNDEEAGLLPGWDSDPSNDCDDASTPVKSITLDAQSQCLNDTPWFHYAVTPYNIGDPAANPIALIWWTQAAFDARNPLIDAGDQAAILANGAAAVQYIAYPAGWSSGDVIEGSELWPGAAVDAQGNPTAWPGWTKQANGTWVIDPAAPFYQLRSSAVVEIRINPSSDASVVYPPATPNCNAAPDQPKPVTPAGLPRTGADPSGASLLAGLLILTGISAVAMARRRMLRGE